MRWRSPDSATPACGQEHQIYLRIEREVRRPFRKSVDFGRSPEEIYAQAERLPVEGGAAYQPVE